MELHGISSNLMELHRRFCMTHAVHTQPHPLVYKGTSSDPSSLRELSPSCDSHYLCPLFVSSICVLHLCLFVSPFVSLLVFSPFVIHLLSPLFDSSATST